MRATIILDNIARQVPQKLTEAFKQQFVVDNRGAAAGLIGMEMVAKSPPDGYTLLMIIGSLLPVVPHLSTGRLRALVFAAQRTDHGRNAAGR